MTRQKASHHWPVAGAPVSCCRRIPVRRASRCAAAKPCSAATLAVADLERRGAHDPAPGHDEHGGPAVDLPEADRGRAAGQAPLRGRRPEGGPHHGGDPCGGLVAPQRPGQARAVKEGGRVVGEERHQRFGTPRGRGGKERLEALRADAGSASPPPRRAAAIRRRARWTYGRLAHCEMSRIARSTGESRSIRVEAASVTDARYSKVSAGPGIGSPSTSGSASRRRPRGAGAPAPSGAGPGTGG